MEVICAPLISWHHRGCKTTGVCLLTPAAFARNVKAAHRFQWKCQDGCSFALKETEGGGNPRSRTTGRAGQEKGDGEGHCISYCFRACGGSPGSRPSIYYWEKIREWAIWCNAELMLGHTHSISDNCQTPITLFHLKMFLFSSIITFLSIKQFSKNILVV